MELFKGAFQKTYPSVDYQNSKSDATYIFYDGTNPIFVIKFNDEKKTNLNIMSSYMVLFFYMADKTKTTEEVMDMRKDMVDDLSDKGSYTYDDNGISYKASFLELKEGVATFVITITNKN